MASSQLRLIEAAIRTALAEITTANGYHYTLNVLDRPATAAILQRNAPCVHVLPLGRSNEQLPQESARCVGTFLIEAVVRNVNIANPAEVWYDLDDDLTRALYEDIRLGSTSTTVIINGSEYGASDEQSKVTGVNMTIDVVFHETY